MDTQQNIFVPSDREIEKMNEDIYPHIESKLKKIFNSQNKKEAHFVNSPVEQWIFDYKTNPNDFVKLSVQIANHIFEEKRKTAKNLLDMDIPISKIVKATGLSEEEINALN